MGFYVPLAQCTRSVSFEALNIELVPGSPIELDDCASSSKQGVPAGEVSLQNDGRANRVRAIASVVRGVRVRPKGGGHERELRTLAPITVRLVSEESRLASEEAEALSPRR